MARLPTRARTRPAASPGLPRPEGRPRRAANGAPGDRLPHGARPRGALRLQPDHRPAGARRARPRAAPRAHARARHVRPAAAHRPRLRRRTCRSPRRCSARPRSRDPADRGPARIGRRGRRGRAWASSPARRRSTSSGCACRRRAAPARAGPPAGRAVPGLLASDLEHDSLYDLLTERYGDAGRAGPRGRSSRSCCPPARRACSSASRGDAGAPHRGHRLDRGRRTRSNSAGRSSAATARATTWNASSSGRAGCTRRRRRDEAGGTIHAIAARRLDGHERTGMEERRCEPRWGACRAPRSAC